MTTKYRHAVGLITVAGLLFGCAARKPDSLEMLNAPPCENARGVLWAGPKQPDDRAQLVDWCRSVGSVIVRTSYEVPVDVAESGLTILIWNKHENYGDLERLLESYRGENVVALVQEVARASKSVPLDVTAPFRVPNRIGPRHTAQRDIAALAEHLNLSLVYLPSMPNGAKTGEDRGNAILSTLPISDIVGIELPWLSQRRVAIMATVTTIKDGLPWRLRVVNIHLDNRSQRWRQAEALANFISRNTAIDLPAIVGGDFNALFGIHDKAVRKMDNIVPRHLECGGEGTFRLFGLQLDHVFTTIPQNIRTRCFVDRDPYGSDHFPIVLHLFTNTYGQDRK